MTIVLVRVYLPSTLPVVATLLVDRGTPGPADGWAVTPALVEAWASGDQEELEHVAQTAAATDSLTLLAADPSAPRRRVVLAVDVDDDALVEPDPAGEPGRVRTAGPVSLDRVASVLVDEDDPEVADHVRRALHDLTDERALGDVDDHPLLWFAAQEAAGLVDGRDRRA